MSIRAAISGVGNCASALVQGVEYYRDVETSSEVPGVMHAYFGEYHIRDIEFVAAFDVSELKIGRDLSEAIFAEPNCCARFSEVPETGVIVQSGPLLDGVDPKMLGAFHVDRVADPADVVGVLRESEADMLINLLPVGSKEATRFYAETSIEAGCAFVNCIPEFIVSDGSWAEKFIERGLPCAGDDVKSQLGATILHRAVASLFDERGVKIDSTYQMNIGGNTDFLNMTENGRLETKRISKTEAVKSLIPYDMPTRIGPSDYVSFLEDHKVCFIRVNGHGFGNLPMELDMKLKVCDSPNSAGIVIDVIRAAKIALDRGVSGPLTSISSYAFKHPPEQVPDHIARRWVEGFIEGRRER